MKEFVIINTHAVDYHVPLYRAIENKKDINLRVFFMWNVFSDKYLKKIKKDSWSMKYDKTLYEGYKCKTYKNISPFEGDNFFGLINPEIIKYILTKKIDSVLIFGYNNIMNWFILIICSLRGVNIIFKGESDNKAKRSKFVTIFKSILLRLFFSKVNFFLCSYKMNIEYYKYFGVSSNKLLKAPCFVDNNFYQQILKEFECDKELINKNKNKFNFLFCGRLNKRKNPLMAIQAIEDLFKFYPNIHLYIVGDGPLKWLLNEYVKEKNLSSIITFEGFKHVKSDLCRYYFISDALILPSLLDPSPKCLNECMNFSTIPIVSDLVGTANDMVVHHYNGMVFKSNSLKDLKNNIKVLIENKELKKKLSSNALKTVLYSWNLDNNIEAINYAINS